MTLIRKKSLSEIWWSCCFRLLDLTDLIWFDHRPRSFLALAICRCFYQWEKFFVWSIHWKCFIQRHGETRYNYPYLERLRSSVGVRKVQDLFQGGQSWIKVDGPNDWNWTVMYQRELAVHSPIGILNRFKNCFHWSSVFSIKRWSGDWSRQLYVERFESFVKVFAISKCTFHDIGLSILIE